MSLATRCTACGTIFRVVQDQLKVSEGWVRCGRCSEVFNALDGLFDLGRESPPRLTPAAAARIGDPRLQPGAGEFVASRIPPPAEEAVDDTAAQTPRQAAQEDEFVSSVAHEPPPIDALFEAAIDARRGSHDDFVDARFPSEFPTEVADDANAAHAAAAARFEAEAFDPRHDEGAPTIHAADELTPAFVREADRAARWQRPGVQVALAGGVLLLLLGLVLQLGLHFRDPIVARWPQAGPALVALCEPLGCSIEPLRRIQSVVVDGSALNRAADGSGYRLEISLRNRDELPVALPAVDLQLTDSSGATVVRRVLPPESFRVSLADAAGDGAAARRSAARALPPAVLEPGRELPLELVFSTSNGIRVAGYSIELFYP
ncbi:zinc-ribbon and DUF3426 domain-containing protein [Rivibacter subsaxonicus]|uniref:Putative Zn finger-like uncharacterized protein n=1 Tax=Rivibacter subsaxonicus TaxID=457575 RepID=A0A4Q7VGC7_9BURK|nr:zinc-ribbon and DUF3426 domain-containing protein [Rivibacter subsaxonicus]RZT95073.1 putative Zn finger-like uncharacterized protein [Rivibacter subsaxonicus]